METMSWVWLALVVVFIILEAATAELVSIWFMAGAVVAFISTLFGAELWVQLALFVIVSVAVLLIVRPIIIKRAKAAVVPTNADMLIGKVGVVIGEIDNDLGVGRVEISGLDWAAVSETGENIMPEQKVTVKRIEGVKLIVTPAIKEN